MYILNMPWKAPLPPRELGQSICPACQRRLAPITVDGISLESGENRSTSHTHQQQNAIRFHATGQGWDSSYTLMTSEQFFPSATAPKRKWIPTTSVRKHWTVDRRTSIAHLICSMEARAVARHGQLLEFSTVFKAAMQKTAIHGPLDMETLACWLCYDPFSIPMPAFV